MTHHIRYRRLQALGLILCLGWASGASADDPQDAGQADLAPAPAQKHHHDHDHDRARHARHRGEIRPMAEILTLVAAEVPGEVIEVELERERVDDHLCWVYELKVLAPDGRLLEVEIDASSGRLLEVEED